MKHALVVAVLVLAGCGWVQRRAGCGLTCPPNSHCAVVTSGVFTATYGCVCDTQDGETYRPSKGHPCPVPSPSVKP